jgi:hypothetical protein
MITKGGIIMYKKTFFVVTFLLFTMTVQRLQVGMSQTKGTSELLQTIGFSSPDAKIMHKAELYGPVYNPAYSFPRGTVLKLDGKIAGTLDRTKYVGGNIALGEITNDNQNEVFFYQYSTGSGGAMGLYVYSLIDGVWKRIFTDPRDKVNSNSNRFTSEYAGKMHLRFYDTLTGLSGVINMTGFHYSENQLKKMTFQTDPICEYIIHHSNCIGNRIETIQWVFAFSHPTSVLSVHNIYIYQFDKKEFALAETKVLDNEGVILAKKKYH